MRKAFNTINKFIKYQLICDFEYMNQVEPHSQIILRIWEIDQNSLFLSMKNF